MMGGPTFIVPPGASGARAYMCFPVEDAVTSRSSVMTGIMDTEGIVELPDGVEFAEYMSWSATRSSSASALSAADLSMVLQVGDVLGDKDMPTFAGALARRLDDTQWSDDTRSDEMQAALMSLNSNVKQLVFGSLSSSVDTVLASWPLALQQIYFDAMVANGTAMIGYRPNGKLLGSMPVGPSQGASHHQTILTHLARTAPPGGLHSLSLHTPIATLGYATLLSHVLLHHATSLSTVMLASLAPAPPAAAANPAAALCRSLRCLGHLTSLNLGIAQAPAAAIARTAHALADSITALHHLASFSLHECGRGGHPTAPSDSAMQPAPDGGGAKRARLSLPSPAAPFDTVTVALSAAPSLTELTLSCADRPQSCEPWPFSHVDGPFLRLARLSVCAPVVGHRPRVRPAAPDALPPCISPLPSLTSLNFRCGGGADPRPSAVVAEALTRQPALQNAYVTLPHPDMRTAAVLHRRCYALTQLQQLSVQFGPSAQLSEAAVAAAVVALAQLPALTQLHLTVSNATMHDVTVGESPVPILQPLGTLTALQELRVHFGDVDLDSAEWLEVQSAVLQMPLSALTHLTSLSCTGSGCSFNAAAIAPHLQRLTRLRELCLESVSCESRLRGCLESLVCLEVLELELKPFDAGMVRCVGECLQRMPGMREVTLTAWGEVRESAWFHATLQLPPRGTYLLQIHREFRQWVLDAYDEVHVQLAGQGAEVELGFDYVQIRYRGV